MRAKVLVLVVATFVTALWTSQPSATASQFFGPTPYLSSADSPFDGGTFDYFFLEDFEDGLLNTPGVAANGGSVQTPSGTTDSVDGDDGSIDGWGTAGNSWYPQVSSLVFTFDELALGGYPTHAGVVWTDLGGTGTDNVTLEAFNSNGVSIGTVGPSTVGDGAWHGETAEDRLFGVTNSTGISKITLTSGIGSVDWEADHLQYGRAPNVGGIAELPDVEGSPLETEGSSGSGVGGIAGITAAIMASIVALGGGAWYVRRRLAR